MFGGVTKFLTFSCFIILQIYLDPISAARRSSQSSSSRKATAALPEVSTTLKSDSLILKNAENLVTDLYKEMNVKEKEEQQLHNYLVPLDNDEMLYHMKQSAAFFARLFKTAVQVKNDPIGKKTWTSFLVEVKQLTEGEHSHKLLRDVIDEIESVLTDRNAAELLAQVLKITHDILKLEDGLSKLIVGFEVLIEIYRNEEISAFHKAMDDMAKLVADKGKMDLLVVFTAHFFNLPIPPPTEFTPPANTPSIKPEPAVNKSKTRKGGKRS